MKEIARAVYEATRLEARWSKRSIIPERWEKRDKAFQDQMVKIIKKYIKLNKLPTPKQAHDSWVKSYLKMGWKYGKKRDKVLKTHPDMVDFNKLPKDERDKDAIFLSFVWLVKEIQPQKLRENHSP